jgi:pyruvate dehydrogenase E2 component (dihydrolipoamide acetyltransferase)
MPQVGQDIEEGKIVEWHVKENDSVEKGDILVTVESEKAAFDVEAEAAGVILKILYPAGEEAKVFDPIAYMGEAGESVEEIPEKAEAEDASVQAEEELPSEEKESTGAASPSAIRVAREKGIDLGAVKGSGPGGRIIKRDVEGVTEEEKAPSIQPKKPSDDEVVPFTRMRKKIADRLIHSKQTIPHFYLFTEVDMTKTVKWRKAYNEKNNARVTINDIIIKTTATALTEFPKINANVEADNIIVRKNINIGVAVTVPDGLLVPVIADADKKDIMEISRISKKNAASAREGKIDPNLLGSFTISNLGMYPITQFIPIINPPEVTILGVGCTQKRVVPEEEGLAIRDVLTISIACDHRAVDGAYGAEFLGRIKFFLESFK